MLVVTTGAGVTGFTLDTLLGEWVVTHRCAAGSCKPRPGAARAVRVATTPPGRCAKLGRRHTRRPVSNPTHPSGNRRDIKIKARGEIYSLNDAR